MCSRYVALKLIHWGLCPQGLQEQLRCTVLVSAVCTIALVATRIAAADPPHAPSAAPSSAAPAGDAASGAAPSGDAASGDAASDAASSAVPSSAAPVVVAPANFTPSWDLDGTYLWLGPLGAASRIDARWDSTFGGDLALVVVRERAPLALVGGDLGASRWTARGGGRVWVDGLLGTHLAGRMVGLSLGPLVELSELAHPRLGASIGVWAFAGITPFARVGAVAEHGIFAELGVHLALPVLRR